MLEKPSDEDNDRLREIAPSDRDHSGASAGSRPRVFPTNLLYFLPQRVPQQARNPGGLHGGEREPNKRVSLTPSIFCSMQFRRRYSSHAVIHGRFLRVEIHGRDLLLDTGGVGSRGHFLTMPITRVRQSTGEYGDALHVIGVVMLVSLILPRRRPLAAGRALPASV
jgi:hypothetical protein